MIVLGLESSCDETAAALVELDADGSGRILASKVYTQKEHLDYGGVVPEIAARAHLEKMPAMVRGCLKEANLGWPRIDAVAATTGPGLLGGVLVGTMYGKSLALALDKPFMPVNHLEGHALTACLTNGVDFPFLLLLVSGGHCQFLLVEGLGVYTTLGGTIDDAVGEAFDKVAKLMGFNYPGGPKIQRLAENGNPKAFNLPLPLRHEGLDFSFSGLKTAVRTQLEKAGPLTDQLMADMAASFQETVARLLEIKTERALAQTHVKTFVLAGGVAANTLLRGRLEGLCHKKGVTFCAPPVNLCTDNAVMIAYAGARRLLAGEKPDLASNARARWPLEELKKK
ncbi:MAG: tRNA (adenosine(37)-N6)-threonylcarbamoyltransferase complex transferase subunit TsaD [Proteobacteria bacterium]|nr:tRNA (adenosine(37)-N6)-threonylcarbamoyltransferase complex transferase subunit TsaD [Pseudomonadota bacterium]